MRRAGLRRWLLAAWLLAALPCHAMGADAAVFIEPDAPPRALHHWQPAGSALDRFTSRAGAWYALAYLPMAPGWPVELQLWAAGTPGSLRLLALDQAPDDGPSFAVSLPTAVPGPRNRPGPALTSRLRLPAASARDGVFVLIEQWSADAPRPVPLWLQLRSHTAPAVDARAPWWDGSRTSGPATPPASPLTREARDGAPFELPLPAARPAPNR